MKKFFYYDNENISGVSFLTRIFLQNFLAYFFIGIYLMAVTFFKRTMSISNDKTIAWISTILFTILNLLALAVSTMSLMGLPLGIESTIVVVALVVVLWTMIIYPAKYTNTGNKKSDNEDEVKPLVKKIVEIEEEEIKNPNLTTDDLIKGLFFVMIIVVIIMLYSQ